MSYVFDKTTHQKSEAKSKAKEMSASKGVEIKITSVMNSKQLQNVANEFLNSKKSSNNLVNLIQYFRDSIEHNLPVIPCLLTLEQIFAELLRRREMYIEVKPLKPKDCSSETQYKEWLQECYRSTLVLILSCFNSEKDAESTQALVTAMRLLCHEGKYPIEHLTTEKYYFPFNRLRNILKEMLSEKRTNSHLFNRFKEYGAYLDVLFYSWKLLPGLTTKGTQTSVNYIQNYFNLITVIPITTEVQESKQLFCDSTETQHCNYQNQFTFDYGTVRKYLNNAWRCAIKWDFSDHGTHKQILIVLLETIMPHLEKPVLLTDFLMDSLDVGGPISLLALQGVFTLIQQHNLTYPNVYEKLYSMFEPEIFHTKFKARLFYLADIFLSSISLPEIMVAAFVKRLARLSLVAPPQDIVIILYFIGNLIIRHPGLKRLICHPHGGQILHDPFLMDERVPNKSNALESSLWEVMSLQQHALPSIAQAAKFISNPLPGTEWDLARFLELNEDDLFDQEIMKKYKECPYNIDRPKSIFTEKKDKFVEYWQMF